jgi:hypothetical protein
MSDAATGRPMDAPAESPGPPTVTPEKSTSRTPSGAGAPSTADGTAAEGLSARTAGPPAGQSGGEGAGRRRRGSRGGRGRPRTGATVTPDGEGGAPASATLAAAPPRATADAPGTVPPPVGAPSQVPAERPKIGDTRPARPPVPGAPGAVAGGAGANGGKSPGSASSGRGQSRTGGGGRGRQRDGGSGGPGARPSAPARNVTGTVPSEAGPKAAVTRADSGPKTEGRRGGASDGARPSGGT